VATPADAFDRLPKVELHRHVEGTMRPATVVELARRNGVALPTADPTLLYQYDSLDSFLAVFWLVQSTLATRDHWARLAYETVVDGAAHGIVHREAFFTPARHLAGGHDLAAIVGGLHDGIAAAEAETGVTCLLIADIDRAYGPSAGLELVKRLAELRHSGAAGMDRVVSVGMDSTERGIDPASYRPAFAAAHADGFRAHLRRDGSALGRLDPTARMAHDPALGGACTPCKGASFWDTSPPPTWTPGASRSISRLVPTTDSVRRSGVGAMRPPGILSREQITRSRAPGILQSASWHCRFRPPGPRQVSRARRSAAEKAECSIMSRVVDSRRSVPAAGLASGAGHGGEVVAHGGQKCLVGGGGPMTPASHTPSPWRRTISTMDASEPPSSNRNGTAVDGASADALLGATFRGVHSISSRKAAPRTGGTGR
jgi:hypothetical protein